jgi:hypothetical protein
MNIMPNVAASPSQGTYPLEISFGRSGTITTIPNGGIDLGDGDLASWTEQQSAWFDIIPRWPARDLTLTLTAIPFLVPDRIQFQQVFIYVNGLFCGLTSLFDPQETSFHIPRNFVSGRSTRIALAIPTAISPQHLGISADVRTLGIALTAVSIAPQ